MKEECLEIGTIQAFVDGELSPNESAVVSGHSAACDSCALLLAEAEEENALVFAALDRELESLVPTQRLWARISDSIEVENEKHSIWNRVYAFLTTQMASPSFAAAALLIVFGVSAVVFTLDSGIGSLAEVANSVPVVSESGGTVATIVTPSVPQLTAPAETVSSNDSRREPIRPITVGKSNHSPEELRRIVGGGRKQIETPQPQYLNYQYLPGEESYVRTIGELEQNSGGGSTLKASGQVAFQRDLAVVDDSIKRMRDFVRKNPRNQSAKQVLYASYQDKIDLLNSAVQRDELMATIR